MDSLMPARGLFAKGTPFPAAKKENIFTKQPGIAGFTYAENVLRLLPGCFFYQRKRFFECCFPAFHISREKEMHLCKKHTSWTPTS